MALSSDSLIHAPSPICQDVSPVIRLPVELTLHIFRLCEPGIRARLDLTHICRQWRSIAINSPSLWNFVQISLQFTPHSKRSDNLIALLDVQLGRAGGLPLDVEWISNTTYGLDPRLLDLIRQKGPFSQWRTLTVRFLSIEQSEAFTLDSRDVFTNLESLTILPSIFNKILETIDRTITPKLQVLEVPNTAESEVETNYKGMMQHIRRLKISTMGAISIPSNVLEVEARVRTTHYFPHIKKYTLTACVFHTNQPYDLKGLTTLTATIVIVLNDDVNIYFPALRHLACGAFMTGDRTKVEAPVLETLHLLPPDRSATNQVVDHMIRGLNLDGYILSPTKSITLDLCLPQHTIVIFLGQSPRVERVSLSFEDAVSAKKMLGRMEGLTYVNDSEGRTLGSPLCKKMVELRMNLGYDICDLESWKRWASRFVESRRTFASELRVYASWKGEGTYVLLA
jgi:hypothetical protein